MKYVIFAGNNFVIIPDSMAHSDVRDLENPVSAGFCSIEQTRNIYDDIRYKVACWGKSDSLGLKASKEDGIIIGCSLR
jgi:hypothetical protein